MAEVHLCGKRETLPTQKTAVLLSVLTNDHRRWAYARWLSVTVQLKVKYEQLIAIKDELHETLKIRAT